MRPGFVAAGLGIVAAVALAAGCAGPSVGPSSAGPAVSPAVSLDEVSGTWLGSIGQVYASLYVVEATCVVLIQKDGTFTATVTPSPAANNLAKPSTWSGRVTSRGDRVTFRTAGPSVTLLRTGHTLYGVASDPLTEADVMIRLDRDGPRS